MYYSKNSELKITLLLVNIIVNTECQHIVLSKIDENRFKQTLASLP